MSDSPTNGPGSDNDLDNRTVGALVRQLAPAFAFLGFFIYVYVDTHDLQRNAGQFPASVAAVGAVLVVLYIAGLFFPVLAGKGTNELGDDAPKALTKEQWGRTIRTYAWIGLMILLIWVGNFHIGMPLFLVVYLYRYAGVRRAWVLALTALVVLAAVTLFYGEIIRTTWPESVLERALDVDFQRQLMRWIRGSF